MDEVRLQFEPEFKFVEENIAKLDQYVDKCIKDKLLAKQGLMDLEIERKEQDDKLYWLTLENTRLAKLTEEKEQNARSLMEHWEQLAFEISNLLDNGNAQLDYATYEVASISDICSHKSWICEQFGKLIKGISKRDSLIEEAQKNLEAVGNELDVLRDLNAANKENALRAAAVQEQLIKDNEEANERLEELFKKNILLDQNNHHLEGLHNEMCCITREKSNLKSNLNKMLTLVKGNEAIAAKRMENLFMEKEELKLRLMEMSVVLEKLHGNEVIYKESENMKTIAIERLKKELLDASILLGLRDNLQALDEANLKLRESEKFSLQKNAIIQEHTSLIPMESKLRNLQASLVEKDENLEHIQKILKSNNTEVMNLVLAVEDQFMGLNDAFVENFTLINQELDGLKSWMCEHMPSRMFQKEMLDLNSLLSKRSHILQEFQKEINVIKHSKEHLESQVSILKERLEMIKSLTKVNETVATEAQQIVVERKSYAHVKEKEVLLLEELKCAVNALQEEVKIVKEEVERQRLQRNEMEMEEDSVCDTAKSERESGGEVEVDMDTSDSEDMLETGSDESENMCETKSDKSDEDWVKSTKFATKRRHRKKKFGAEDKNIVTEKDDLVCCHCLKHSACKTKKCQCRLFGKSCSSYCSCNVLKCANRKDSIPVLDDEKSMKLVSQGTLLSQQQMKPLSEFRG